MHIPALMSQPGTKRWWHPLHPAPCIECVPSCKNGGTCAASGLCTCEPHYYGSSCQYSSSSGGSLGELRTYVYAIILMIAIVDMYQSRCTSQQCAVHFGQVNKYLYYKHTYSCIVCGVSLVWQCLSCHFVQEAVPNIYPVLCLEEDC